VREPRGTGRAPTIAGWTRAAIVGALFVAAAVSQACHSPTAVTQLDGTFPLASWNGLPLPVDLGAFPPSTCSTRIDNGALSMSATYGTFLMYYEQRDCRNAVVPGGSRVDGYFVQAGDSVDFSVGCLESESCLHFPGAIRSDRIVVRYSPLMEFSRTGR
jgi:hypothetical protein